MILLAAIVLGLLVGIGLAHWRGIPYQPPDLQYLWLVFPAYLPQFVIFYIPNIRVQVPDSWTIVLLTGSQFLLLGFAWLNRRWPGMRILLVGAALNFTVMAANGGFMPISPQTAGRLIPEDILQDIPIGSRFGIKDILLNPQDTRFEWLADRFLLPAWSVYQAAFSLGDVFIAIGAFRLLAAQKASISTHIKEFDMIASLAYQPQIQMKVAPISASNGLSRVFAAAVVNRHFCQMLLHDPHHALQTGFLGETFKLSDEERDLIVSIRAESLSDLARQVNLALMDRC